MTFRVRSVPRCFVFVLVLAGLCPTPGSATEPAPATAPGWQPLAFHYQDGRIDLLEAVRLTLSQDPNLLLRAVDVEDRGGRLLEQSGLFDWTLRGQLTYEHRVQELTESVRQGEVDKRNQIRDVEVVSCQEEQNLRDELADLQRAQTTTGVDIRNDRGFDAQIQLLEAAILTADDDAQRQALLDTRSNLIATEIAVTQDAILAAAQVCTEAGAGLARLGEVPVKEEFDSARLDFRAEKLTRSGIGLTPFLRGSYDDTQFVGKSDGFFTPALDPRGNPLISPSGIPLERLVDFGGKNNESLYGLEIGFEVNLPLLRGRGVDATAAGETAARIDYTASELLLEHGASESVLNTLFAYWNLVAAEEQVRVLESSVLLQGRLVELTRALIGADELPGAEEARAVAGQANAQAQLESARRDRVRAQTDLVRAIGLTVQGMDHVPSAADGFPPPPDVAALRDAVEDLVLGAVGRRLDLQASQRLVESGEVLARAAVTDLRPRLDLTLGAWLVSRGENSLSEAIDHTASSPSWKTAAAFEKPLGNRSARGRLLQSEALVHRRQISVADLERQIRIAVVQTLGSLAESVEQLRHAEAGALAAQRTIDTELEKLKLGETTLIDAILTEQQRTNALLAVVFARFQVATLVNQLRFETGTLVENAASGNRVSRESLLTPPAGGRS